MPAKCTDTYAIGCNAPFCLRVRTTGWDMLPSGLTVPARSGPVGVVWRTLSSRSSALRNHGTRWVLALVVLLALTGCQTAPYERVWGAVGLTGICMTPDEPERC